MTTFNKTYDITTPAGSDDPAEADDRMQEIKAAVQERENVDHYWPLTGTEVSDEDTGEHRKVILRVGDAPAAMANKGVVYAKDVGDKAELFYRDEDGNEVQITTGGILKSLNLTGVQTVAGVKTFSSIPKIPTAAPTADAEVAGKKYVDDTYLAGQAVQVVNTQTGTKQYFTGTTPIPYDNTIPQKTEGSEVMTLAITPTNASNKLKIEVTTIFTHNGTYYVSALFQDTTANALACAHNLSTGVWTVTHTFTHYMVAGTTNEIIFKVRVGGNGTTTTFNGSPNDIAKYGGTLASSTTVTEIKV